jgi:hypothetical protein
MNDSPTYLAFQNREGFNFVSLESLYKEEVKQSFHYNMKGRDILTSGKSVRKLENDYKRINSIELPDSFDNVYKMTQGAFASTLHSYDVVTKEYKQDKYQYLDEFEEKEHLNKFSLTPQKMKEYFNENSYIMTDFRQYGIFNEYGDVSNYRIMQERISSLIQAEGITVRIIVPGRTDYTVGQKVNLEIVKTDPTNSSSKNIKACGCTCQLTTITRPISARGIT